MREASSLSIAARHSRHWGEAKASLGLGGGQELQVRRQSLLALRVCLNGGFQSPLQQANEGGGFDTAIGCDVVEPKVIVSFRHDVE
mgnify:CR=1 FL=1